MLVIMILSVTLAISMMDDIKQDPRSAIIAIFILAIAVIPLTPFISSFVTNFFSDIIVKNFMMSEGKIKVEKDYSLAKALEVRGELTKAVEEYKKIIEKDPKDIIAQLNLAEIYHRKIKNYKEALNIYKRLLETKIEDSLKVFILNQMADIFDAANQYDQAKESLEEIMKRYPDTKFARQAKSRIAKYLSKNT